MFRPKLFKFSRHYFATAEQWPSRFWKNWEAASCFSNQNNCHIFWKWLKMVKKYPSFSNFLSKAMRNISLNVNCVMKRYQNLQTPEFTKAWENSNNWYWDTFRYCYKNTFPDCALHCACFAPFILSWYVLKILTVLVGVESANYGTSESVGTGNGKCIRDTVSKCASISS